MNIAGIEFSELLDMAFVLLVAGVTVKGLFARTADHEASTRVWREELTELERSLRDLISQAAVASAEFDKNLVERKEEIERLLDRAEGNIPQERRAKPEQDSTAKAKSETRPGIELDLSSTDDRKFVMGSDESDELLALLATADSTRDAIATPSGSAASTTSRTKLQDRAPIRARTITRVVDTIGTAADQTYRQLSMIDHVTYKIARRLLSEGKEIHVVARKLELPVSEMRLLDRLMRQEKAPQLAETEVEETERVSTASPKSRLLNQADIDFQPLLPSSDDKMHHELASTVNVSNSVEVAVI